MKYNKPTVEGLGEAVSVIQGSKTSSGPDAPNPPGIAVPPPAYELDE
jgi:hypothetical protein